jgi:hypothetical protein
MKILLTGQRDPAFMVTLAYGPFAQNDHVGCLALQPDGKILVGMKLVEYPVGPPVFRLLPDGRPDPSFATSWPDEPMDISTCSHLLPQPDGRIVIAGYFPGSYSHLVMRLEANGVVDRTFGFVDGNSTPEFTIKSIQQLPDSTYLLAGGIWQINGVARGNIARLQGEEFCVALPGAVRLVSPEKIGAGLRFGVETVPGVTYHLEAAEELSHYTFWQSITNAPGTGGQVIFAVPAPREQKYWRVRLQCP